jgi:hypothetical protein
MLCLQSYGVPRVGFSLMGSLPSVRKFLRLPARAINPYFMEKAIEEKFLCLTRGYPAKQEESFEHNMVSY